ncbi:hypothetical protein B0H13DRAFT_2303187 [Mycena leptocephala]|nr:hypothetical protein B0H13DRAFT_2303187 [Mycena leptocephala]
MARETRQTQVVPVITIAVIFVHVARLLLFIPAASAKSSGPLPLTPRVTLDCIEHRNVIRRIKANPSVSPLRCSTFSSYSRALTFLCGSVLSSVVGNTALPRSANASLSPEFRPLTFVGNVAAVATNAAGNTRIYYQNPDNSIQESIISGPFVVGTFDASTLLVPADEVLCGTPIVATTISGTGFPIRVFFISPSYILSDGCITANQFAVEPGSTVLYALADSTPGTPLRVGFVSAGQPGMLTEADYTAGKWQLASLP